MFEAIKNLISPPGDLDSPEHAKRKSEAGARKKVRDAARKALFADLDRQRADRVAADIAADEADVERVDAQRSSRYGLILVWWLAAIETVVVKYRELDTRATAGEVAATWNELVERCRREIGITPPHYVLSTAIAQSYTKTHPSVVCAPYVDDDMSKRLAPAAMIDAVVFHDRLRSYEAHLLTIVARAKPTATDAARGSFDNLRHSLSDEDRRQRERANERRLQDDGAELARARSLRIKEIAPDGTSVVDGRTFINGNGRGSRGHFLEFAEHNARVRANTEGDPQ
jgi:hypothetical protein